MSEHPIAEFSAFPGRVGTPRAGDDFMYVVHKVDYLEDDPETRAFLLNAAANEALDRIDLSGVAVEDLHHPDVRVRAFYTFDPGSETIGAGIVNRLATINAAIWVDSHR